MKFYTYNYGPQIVNHTDFGNHHEVEICGVVIAALKWGHELVFTTWEVIYMDQ